MDKMIQTQKDTTITNDGATILGLLDIVHPAAKTLVDIAKSQDNEVGDGTTTVTLLAGELLKESKGFIEEGMHPQIIIKGLREALRLALGKLQELAVSIDAKNETERRNMLLKCAQTALNSKLVRIISFLKIITLQLAGYKEHFSELVVSSVERLDPNLLDKDLVGIKLVTGGSITV